MNVLKTMEVANIFATTLRVAISVIVVQALRLDTRHFFIIQDRPIAYLVFFFMSYEKVQRLNLWLFGPLKTISIIMRPSTFVFQGPKGPQFWIFGL